MKKFEGFKYNKFVEKDYSFEEAGDVKEYHYIKDCKSGRKVELVETYYYDTSLDEEEPYYSASYYAKASKKGKHDWYMLCGGFTLEETINFINIKINNWRH